nr:zinc finger BED domain-containing protein RICESLEEPER 2 [Tanacetum cinerariifolium]
MTWKLLVAKKGGKVLFAEATKECGFPFSHLLVTFRNAHWVSWIETNGGLLRCSTASMNCSLSYSRQACGSNATMYKDAVCPNCRGSMDIKMNSILPKKEGLKLLKSASKSNIVLTKVILSKADKASESAFSTSGRVVSIPRTRLTLASLGMCMCLKDHLDAQERKQDKSTLETSVDFEEEILDAEVQENEAILLSDEEIALDAASSEGSMFGPGLGGEEDDNGYDMTNYNEITNCRL